MITPLVTASVLGARKSLSPFQKVLPQANVVDAARSCARTYRTPGKVSRTKRDGSTPRDASSSETSSRVSFQSPSCVVTSVSPAQFREQNIFNPRHPGSIVNRDRSSEPFDAHINGSPPKNSDSTSFFSYVVALEEVSGEVSDVDASKITNFASNPVLDKTPRFVDLRLSTINTADKLNSLFAPRYHSGRIDRSLQMDRV